MEKREVFLEKNKSTVSVNKERELEVALSAKTRVLPYSDINEKLSLIKLYNSEKDACNRYRMIFTINPICTNVLFNAKTEVVRLEGSEECKYLPQESGSTVSDGFAINTTGLNTLQAIRDTEYTHKDFFDGENPYVYHCGWDIFNNHMLRSDDFTYISKVGSGQTSKDAFNTISDYLRDKDGKIISEKISPNSSGETNMHVYQYDTILSMYNAFRNRLDEKNGWYGFTNPGNIEIANATLTNGKEISINKMMNNNKSCELYELYPDQSLYSFIPKVNKFRNRLEYNWDYDLVYPYENDYKKLGEIVGIKSNKIIQLKVLEAKRTSSTSGSDFVRFKTMFKHTFKQGDYVVLYYLNEEGEPERINKRFKIVNCGDSEGNNTNRYFSIRVTDLSSNFSFNSNGEVILAENNEKVNFYYRKDVNGYECKYYIRKFKRLKTERFDSEINKLAFGENIYGDRIAQLIFTSDIDVEGIVDNLGRPLSEVYLYFFKTNRGHDEWYKNNNYTGETVEYSHCFGKVTSGLDLTEEETDYNVRKLHNVDFVSQARMENYTQSAYLNGFQYVYSGSIITESEQPEVIDDDLTIESLDSGCSVYGDIVEFDQYNYIETIIENIYHRFNTAQRETSNPKYFDIWDDEIQYDDYDIGINVGANGFKVVSGLTNTVASGDTTLRFPGNICPEGYFYNPKTAIKLADVSNNVSNVIVKQIKYSGWTDVDAFSAVTAETVDEEGNTVVAYHGNFSAITKYDFVKGDFIALYQSEDDKIYYGVVDGVSGNTIDVMFSEMPCANALVSGSSVLLTTRDYVAPYATFLPSSRAFVWRDLVKPSELHIDSALYDRPFSNGCFYIHQNVNFFLKRQDPRNEFGLLYPEDSNNNTKPQTKNYKKPGNSEIDLSAYEVFSDNLKNICY